MIDPLPRLDPADLHRLARLEQRVVAVDGGRLKLEWRTLRSRPNTGTNDLVVRRAGSMIGFAGIYAFGGLEIAGAIDPRHRRRGLGSALLARTLVACREQGAERVLLVVPRTTHAGAGFVQRHGAAFDHSEHALELAGSRTRARDSSDGTLELRAYEAGDGVEVSRLLADAFGKPAFAGRSIPRHTTVVRRQGAVVGTLRVERDGPAAGVYGFAVAPAHQGRGIGRAVLSRVCTQLQAEGVERIGLEVAVDNDRALALYTSIGFVPRVTEDYWSLETASPREP